MSEVVHLVTCPDCRGAKKHADRCPGCWTDKCNTCTQQCPTCRGHGRVTAEVAEAWLAWRARVRQEALAGRAAAG